VKKSVTIGFLAILQISCTASGSVSSVGAILGSTKRHDGNVVTVRGTLSSRDGYLNLFSRSADQCIGLILTPRERATYSQHVGREVSLTGIFEAEGCGQKGICDEHLCGPGVLTHVSLPPSE
jgi:small nuclear ribonucleoprotein (snRNP)-like protein